MGASNVLSCRLQPLKNYSLLNQLFVFFWLTLPHGNSVSFNFSSFQPTMPEITFEGDAFSSGVALQLTKNQLNEAINGSVGRISYAKPVRLWDNSTRRLADFTTRSSFTIELVNQNEATSSGPGDGLSFFMVPFESKLPENSGGGCLGLVNNNFALNASLNQFVAVEFDTFKNKWDPSFDHVGINVNSIRSAAVSNLSRPLEKESRANVWVSYNSTTQNLSVFLTYGPNSVFSATLSYFVDLRKFLPSLVTVGFSAATGSLTELHMLYSWSFESTLDIGVRNRTMGLKIGIAVGFGVLGCGLGLVWFICWRRRAGGKKQDLGNDSSMDDEFEKGTGPRRFTYHELIRATNNFAEEGKLGEGGFGNVYKGLLIESNTEVAVKRVSKGSKQGKKEYISEVKIIGRLRHRNLVQLIGWCHEQNEFLLVYEYMPNGSLDFHLFGGQIMLTWPLRYKITVGLAYALLYLHEEWEQCVVHRDIKSSNVMLDANFDAKLGDFGLARLVDHEVGSRTTVLAGTLGYLAPECVVTGKASKESDMFSFGMVCLEIACGRKPVEPRAEPSKVSLVEWVWELYGRGNPLEAVDQRLRGEFDEQQIECLMVVGLWCCHPDPTIRPHIRQVINVLNFDATLPTLPSKLPVPIYFAPLMDMCGSSNTSSSHTGSTKDRMQHS